MKATRVPIACISGILLLLTAAQAETAWVEDRITNTTWYETGPKVWQDKIYYNSFQNGPADVYAWTATEGPRPVIQGSGTQVVDSVYGDNIVYRSYTQEAQGYADLYLYDPIQGSRPICTAPGEQTNADMFNGLVVWEDHRAAEPQVYIWDEVNGERPISPTNASQYNPRIWGENVVFEDNRNGRWDVYMYTVGEGERRLSNSFFPMTRPAIHRDRVVMWVFDDPEHTWDEAGLWEWTPQHGLRMLASRHVSGYNSLWDMQMWGDIVVYQAGTDFSNIGVWSPASGFGRLNQSAIAEARSPAIYENKVVWSGAWDIYMSTLVPEPAGLAALGLPVIGILLLRARKR